MDHKPGKAQTEMSLLSDEDQNPAVTVQPIMDDVCEDFRKMTGVLVVSLCRQPYHGQILSIADGPSRFEHWQRVAFLTLKYQYVAPL